MKRMLRLAGLTLALWLLAAGSALADDGLPRSPLNLDPAQLPLYESQPVWSYSVDTVAADGALRQLAHLINGLNLARAWVLKLAIRAFEYGITWRLPADFAQAVSKVVTSLRALLWDGSLAPLVAAAVVLTGLAVLWLAAVRGRGRAALETALRLFLTLVIGTMTMGTAGAWVPAALTTTADLNKQIFTETVRPAAPATAGRAAAQIQKWALTHTGDAAWRAFVLYPWAVAEFGSLEAAKRHAADDIPGGALLALTQARRTDWYWTQPQAIRERDLAWWAEEALPRRLTIAMTSLAGAGLFAGALFLLAGAVIFQQFVTLMLAMAAPLVFLLALWPGVGRPVLSRWTRWLLSSLVGQVLATLLLGLVVQLTALISGLEATVGWEMVSFLLAGLAVGVFLLRRLMARRWGRRRSRRSGEERAPVTVERTVRIGREPAPQSVRVEAPGLRPAPAGLGPSPVSTGIAPDQGTGAAANALAQELAVNRTRALIARHTDPLVQRPAGLPRETRESAVPPVHNMINRAPDGPTVNIVVEQAAAGVAGPVQRDLRGRRPGALERTR
ncbi:MAG TPA: hypothetical protein VD969_23330 [Symbiobacteriaceae bacterium]|nr:hypothetical protein [Symbiobacteriaceae bacterium]